MKKNLLTFLLIISLFCNSGCFNYRDINKLLFVTAVIVDIDKDKSPILYVEVFKGARAAEKSTEKGKRLVFKGTGKTIFEAYKDINLAASNRLNLTQNKVIAFTRSAAEYGVDNFIDFFDRDQQALVRPYLAVFDGDGEKLMNINLKDEEYIGMHLYDLIRNQGSSSRVVQLTINEYLIQRRTGDRTSIVTIIQIAKGQLDNKIEVSGGAVIKNDKMVDVLTRREGQGFNFIMDNVKTGTLEITNPNEQSKFVTLQILNSKTKTKVSYEDEVFHLKKTIITKASIDEAQKRLVFDSETINALEKKAESNIKKACEKIFNEYKDKNIDIFDVEEVIYRKYPKMSNHEVIRSTEIEIEVKVKIEGSPDTKDF